MTPLGSQAIQRAATFFRFPMPKTYPFARCGSSSLLANCRSALTSVSLVQSEGNNGISIKATGVARIRDASGTEHTISADEIEIEQVGGSEREMGAELEHEARVEHPVLGDLVWEVWEYPTGAVNTVEPPKGDFTVIQDLEFEPDHQPELD